MSTMAGVVPATTSAAAAREATVDQAGERRSATVESVRALAALGVLAGHVYGVQHGFTAPLGTYWGRLMLGGGLGVWLFFALTGYLLYRPFARHGLGRGGAVDLRRYALNRALRILPLYYAVVILLLPLTGRDLGFAGAVRFATLTETFSTRTVDRVDGPVWSLVVEVIFYCLLPLLAIAVAWVARGSAVRALAALLVLGAVALAVRDLTVGPGTATTWRYSVPATFVFFVPGMVLAVVETAWAERVRRLPGVVGSSTAWLLLAAGLWLLACEDYSRNTVVLAAAGATVGGCVLPLQPGRLTSALRWRPLAALGVASYSLYLWHLPIVERLPALGGGPFAVRLVVAVAVCALVALVSYRVVEEPFLRRRRRWAATSTAAA